MPLASLYRFPLETGQFLSIAIHIAGALAELHGHRIIQGNISPRTIRFNHHTGVMSFAEPLLPAELPRIYQSTSPDTALAYMSPEQTGRMNRAVDYRTDLYSLGVVFYEILTGELPFHARDLVEWTYSHIARTPKPPNAVNPSVPAEISGIVMKLLAKAAEDRYQTASGLKFDLERCLSQWEATKKIRPFALGRWDIPDQLLIPPKLYGREKDIDRLVSAFGRVAESGVSGLAMISGYSGIGKTSLVRELYRPVVDKRGYFISGKFDQYKRYIPYSTIVEAFQELIRQILTESDERIAAWRSTIQSAVGINGQLIVDIIPQASLIIGAQPPVSELPPIEAQNRFNFVFRRFISAFASKEHPLVIFLDDLQWLDTASLQLIEYLAISQDIPHLLIVGAYRDNEVTPSHPLMLALDNIRESRAALTSIHLTPLSFEDVTSLISDALRSDRQQIEPLSRLIYEKTGGNPFFTIQFIKMLYAEEMLEFDHINERWKWDVDRIEAKGYTDNIIDLMASKIRKLSPKTRDVLKMAACVGSSFGLNILALILSRPEAEIRHAIDEAMEEGLAVRARESDYRFIHDRVQQAAYSLIPERQLAELHLHIGRLMLANTPENLVEEDIFEIVSQLNQGAHLITEPGEKEKLVRLNLAAGHKAMAASAYLSAIQFLSAGQALLPPDSWDSLYDLTCDLSLSLARCEWLSGRLDRAEHLIVRLLAHARSRIDRLLAYQIKNYLHATRGEYEEGVRTVLNALSVLYGMELPMHPDLAMLEKAALQTRRELGERSIEGLVDLPVMTDPEMRAMVALLSASLPPAFAVDPKLHDMLCCQIVSVSIRYGNSEFSPHGYVTYGATLGRLFENWEEAYRFGELARKLVENDRFRQGKTSAYVTIGMFINIWVRHVREVIPLFPIAIQSSSESGDTNCACYAAAHLVNDRLMEGVHLSEVAAEAEKNMDLTRHAMFEDMYGIIDEIHHAVQDLREKPITATKRFSQGEESVDEFIGRVHHWQAFVGVNCEIQGALVYGDFKRAVDISENAGGLARFETGDLMTADNAFYTALALAAHWDAAPPEDRHRYAEKLYGFQAQYDVWQRHCPANFANRYALISAEIARIRGQDMDAMRLYDEAIRSASDNGFTQNEALINEFAARFYRVRGFDRIADTYLREARQCYLRWGADGKVSQMDQLYPELFAQEKAATPGGVVARIGQMDAITMAEASQAISREILLPKLLSTMMRIVIENAGAQKGFLLLEANGQWIIAAEGSLEKSEVEVLHPLIVDESDRVPASIVHYVARTNERVVLEDAAGEGAFVNDPYIRRHNVKSALCAPLLSLGRLIGIMYLENNLATRVFTPSRVQFLEALLAQAAVSLENGRVYEALRDSERKFRAIFDQTFQFTGLMTTEGEIVEVNRSALELIGASESDVVGKVFWDTPWWSHSRELQELLRQAVRRAAEGEFVRFEATHRAVDGSLHFIDFSIKPVRDESGRVVMLIPEGRDITERKKMEESVRDAKAEAELYLDLMGHDICNLNQIGEGFLELALDSPTIGEADKELLGNSMASLKRSTHLVENVRKLQKARSSEFRNNRIDACQMITRVIAHFSKMPRVSVTFRQDTPASCHVMANDLLYEVFMNLVGNALKHGGANITISIRLESATIEGRDYNRFIIEDNGSGISDEMKTVLFLRQQRGKTVAGGSGLGLYLVKSLVDSYHGRVWVEDRVPGDYTRGARFVVLLPAC